MNNNNDIDFVSLPLAVLLLMLDHPILNNIDVIIPLHGIMRNYTLRYL
jgi:hypothetical protein